MYPVKGFTNIKTCLLSIGFYVAGCQELGQKGVMVKKVVLFYFFFPISYLNFSVSFFQIVCYTLALAVIYGFYIFGLWDFLFIPFKFFRFFCCCGVYLLCVIVIMELNVIQHYFNAFVLKRKLFLVCVRVYLVFQKGGVRRTI